MPNITITGGTVCAGGEHRTVVTDKGTFAISNAEIQALLPDNAGEIKAAFVIVVRHIYLTRRAAGRTHAQALSDLVGQVVRV